MLLEQKAAPRAVQDDRVSGSQGSQGWDLGAPRGRSGQPAAEAAAGAGAALGSHHSPTFSILAAWHRCRRTHAAVLGCCSLPALFAYSWADSSGLELIMVLTFLSLYLFIYFLLRLSFGLSVS